MFIHPDVYLFGVGLAVFLLFAWIWLDTVYIISDGTFFYRSGPLRGKVLISTISEIHTHVRSFSGLRPALSFEYVRVCYNGGRELFIAPRDEQAFIKELREQNPGIAVKAGAA